MSKRRKTKLNDEIPFDILRIILSFLEPKELENCRLVCKIWNEFIKNQYNYFYKLLFHNYPYFVYEELGANWKKLYKYRMNSKLSNTFVRKYGAYGTYKIHDNGGRPFKFVHYHGKITIYKREKSKNLIDNHGYPKRIYETPVYECEDFIGYWVGYEEEYNFMGNSILIKLNKNTFVFVGKWIYQFEIEDDEMIDYVSPVGNSDVPYPVAFGKKYLYFMLDRKKVKRSDFEREITFREGEGISIYREFFGHIGNKKLEKIDFNVKVIHKRLGWSEDWTHDNNAKCVNTCEPITKK